MKRRISLIAICLVVAFLALLASTQAQRPDRAGGFPQPPGGRFMMSRILPLESSWAQVSFELGVSDERLPKARAVYKEAWDKRSKLIKDAADAGDDSDAIQAARADVERIKADLNAKLKDILSSEQLEKLAKWEEQTQQRLQTPPSPPGTR